MASFCMCDQDWIWCDPMAGNLFLLIHVLWSILICFNGKSFIEFIGWVSFIVHSGFKCCFGWVPFIEHNVFKCWIIQQLWLTNISFYYVQVLIFTSHTQHQGWSNGLKWLAFCTYWLDHFWRKNGFMSFLVDTIGFVILVLIKLFMDSCGPSQWLEKFWT